MTTRYDILPEAQRRLLPLLLTPIRTLGYVLYGGTAIALRLGHRASIDFDFFSDRPLDRGALIEAAPFLADAEVIQDAANTWTLLTPGQSEAPVKVSFFAGLGSAASAPPARATAANCPWRRSQTSWATS